MWKNSSRIARLGLWVIAAGFAAAGCSSNSDECSQGDTRCDGTVAAICTVGTDSYLRWASVDCGPSRSCVQAGGRVFCAVEATPSPLCPQGVDSAEACDGTTKLACQEGYLVGRYPCKSCTPCKSGCASPTTLECESGLKAPCGSTSDCLSGYVCMLGFCAIACGSVPWCPSGRCSLSNEAGVVVQGCWAAFDL